LWAGLVFYPGLPIQINQSLKEQVAELEKKVIVTTLKKCKTIRKSARALSISHPALINKMKKYKIQKISRIHT
jgi:transcriptional regulator with PAS, ATPase and Fis domain